MNPLLKEIRHNPLLRLPTFVPVVFVADHLVPEAPTLLFVLSILAIFIATLTAALVTNSGRSGTLLPPRVA